MKTILLCCAIAFLANPASAHAQLRPNEPTVRYEGRPVEEIVKDGVPVTNYNQNERVIVTERDKALQRQQWQDRQRQEEAQRRHYKRPAYERYGRDLRGVYGRHAQIAYPPVLNRYSRTINEPWRYNLPERGPRYIWALVGYDAVLYDVRTRYPVYIWHNWFR